MNNRDLYFTLPQTDGSVKLLPRTDGPTGRAMRYYEQLNFRDQSFSLSPGDARRRVRRRRRTNAGDQGFAGAVNTATRGVQRMSQFGESMSKDDDPDGEMEEEELVGTLPKPPEGGTYRLAREPDGTIVIELVADTENPPNTNDRMLVHHTRDGKDPVLVRMNKLHRGIHNRDAASMRRTLMRLTPAKGERVELMPNESLAGGYDVVLVSPVVEDLLTDPPKGAMRLGESPEDEDYVEMTGGTGRNGELDIQTPKNVNDRRTVPVSTRAMLQSMNRQNAAFWHKAR